MKPKTYAIMLVLTLAVTGMIVAAILNDKGLAWLSYILAFSYMFICFRFIYLYDKEAK